MYSLLYFCKQFYMFRVVPPPIIRSTCNCNYGIWHWSDRTCYLPLSWRSRNSLSSESSKTADGSKYGLTSARFCNYTYMCSWWLVAVPPQTCRVVLQIYNKLYIVASCWTIIDIDADYVDDDDGISNVLLRPPVQRITTLTQSRITPLYKISSTLQNLTRVWII